MSVRNIRKMAKASPTREGAGVHLHRVFGFHDTSLYDPFLLLDDFRGDDPEAYRHGFPWHPHRGIETITYMLAGKVEHGDSLGNSGVIAPGGVQWMTAGRGIIHQEMPKGEPDGRMYGFQLWANLASTEKMQEPRYQEFEAGRIPVVRREGVEARLICGSLWGEVGPVAGIGIDPLYADISVPSHRELSVPVERGRTAFVYVFEGDGCFAGEEGPFSHPTESEGWSDTDPPGRAYNRSLVLFEDGDEVAVHAGEYGVRFLLIAGNPLREPVAWYGPIVMNTREELKQAFDELEKGTFLQ